MKRRIKEFRKESNGQPDSQSLHSHYSYCWSGQDTDSPSFALYDEDVDMSANARCLKFFAFFLLFHTPFLKANAPEKAFRIILKQKGTGKILKRGKVEIIDTQQTWRAERDGTLVLPAPNPEQSYRITRFAHEPIDFFGKDLKEGIDNVYYMVPAQPSDDAVIVRGVKRKSVSKKTVSITEAKAVAPRGDPAQIAKLLPGVQSTGFGSDVIIRGSEPNESSYYVDGIEVPFIYHSIGQLSIVPEKAIASIDFSSGGFGSEYGNVTGGVIGLKTSNKIPEEPMTQIKVNTPIYSGIYHERPINDKSFVSASIRRSYLELILPRVMPEESTVIPKFYDAHARYVLESDNYTMKVLSLSSLDSLELVVPAGGSEDGNLNFNIRTYFGALGVNHSYKLGKGQRLESTPQVVFSKVNNSIADNKIQIRAYDFRLPLEYSHRLQKTDRFYLGVQASTQIGRADVDAIRIVQDDPFTDFEDAQRATTKVDFREYSYSAWTSYDWRLGDLIIAPGMRGYYFSSIEKATSDPRVKIRYDIDKDRKIKAAAGRYHQIPQPQETDTEFGNPDLTFEFSNHYILGYEHNYGTQWTFEVQYYKKLWYDIIRSDPLLRYNNDGQRRSQGLEIFIRRNQTERAFAWLSYTYSKTDERRSAAEDWGPVETDQTHVLNLVGNYSFSGQWSLGGRLNYHTGDRYTPVSHAVYNTNYNSYQPRYDDDARYKERLPAYNQVDIFTSYDFLYDEWKLKLRGGIEYLALERPAYGVTYNYDYSKKDFFRGVPPIPYIELSGEF